MFAYFPRKIAISKVIAVDKFSLVFGYLPKMRSRNMDIFNT